MVRHALNRPSHRPRRALKIALVAMSGVRVRSAELNALGVSLPGFVARGEVIASLPSLGLLTLAGATPDGHELRYFEHADVTPEQLAADGFDLVAISTFTAQAPEAYALADAIRALGVTVVLGGLHVTVCGDEARAHADAVVLGEGEAVWPELIRDASAGQLQPVYDGRTRWIDLADSPEPRYDLLTPERYNRLTIQTTRSCPHACTFCASGLLLRGPYRKKPIELVRRDLAAIQRVWDEPFVELADDNTFVDPEWSLQLVDAIGEAGVKWFTETDITLADQPALLERLADAGCRQVLIGLEALDGDAVKELEARPFKAGRVARYAEAVQRIQEAGVSVNGCFVLGADHHTPDAFGRVVEFADRVGLAEVQVTVLTPFPGTPLYARMRADGRLLREADWGACTLFDVTYQPERMSVDELERGLRGLFTELYTPEKVRARRRAFHAQVRRGKRRRRTAMAG